MNSTPHNTADREPGDRGHIRVSATTRPLDEPPPSAGLPASVSADDFAWLTSRGGFVAQGVAAEIAPDEVDEFLSAIEVEDRVGAWATGPIACGALPFSDGANPVLRVPARVIGHTDGTWWCTTIGAPPGQPTPDPSTPAPPPDSAARQAEVSEISSAPDREGWRRMVQAALTQIRRGELAKVVLAREVTVTLADAPRPGDLVQRMAHDTASAFVFAAQGFLGASPELLVRRDGRSVSSQPMAGSVPVSGDDGETSERLDALTRSGKDRDEHRVVVEAVADVLEAHTVQLEVPDSPDLVRLPSVAHLATRVNGVLSDDAPSALGLARALHPTPAVGGTPSDRAVALIDVLEPFDRGPYAGPVGWVDARGDGEWAVALRCGRVEGRTARLYAGAGIVSGSDPDREWDETEAKLRPMLTALGIEP